MLCMPCCAPQDDDARKRVETEMEAGPETRAILDALHATRASGGARCRPAAPPSDVPVATASIRQHSAQ